MPRRLLRARRACPRSAPRRGPARMSNPPPNVVDVVEGVHERAGRRRAGDEREDDQREHRERRAGAEAAAAAGRRSTSAAPARARGAAEHRHDQRRGARRRCRRSPRPRRATTSSPATIQVEKSICELAEDASQTLARQHGASTTSASPAHACTRAARARRASAQRAARGRPARARRRGIDGASPLLDRACDDEQDAEREPDAAEQPAPAAPASTGGSGRLRIAVDDVQPAHPPGRERRRPRG